MAARAAALMGVVLALCAGAALAQMYKWKDDQGVVHYSDTPPPRSKQVEVKDFRSAAPVVALPYALAQAVRDNPVTLFTAPGCDGCNQARAALTARGVPFTEKTIANAADKAVLSEAGGKDTLPFVVIGRRKLAGYEAAQLQDALTAAHYPASARLPMGYRNAPAHSAAPAPADAGPPVDVRK